MNAFLTGLPLPPSLPCFPAPLELGLSLLEAVQTLSPAQWPIWPHAEQVLVRFLSSTDLGLPVNLRPKTVDCSFFDVTVRTLAKS
jgi:hypothetical protein